MIIIIDVSSIILLLDRHEYRDDGEAADGEDVAQPPRPNVWNIEETEEEDSDNVVPW